MSNSLLPSETPTSTIIKTAKNQSASIFSASIVKHQILKAEKQAHEMLQQVQEIAAATLAKAEQSAEEIRQNAYNEGREEARLELLEHILAIKEERAQNLSHVEREVLQLSVKIAEKIIGRETKVDENSRAEIVMNALRQTRQQEILTVRVSAEDLPVLEQMRQKIESTGRVRYIDFIPDQAVKTGGCIIESPSGTIDARIEVQLKILETALLARISSEL